MIQSPWRPLVKQKTFLCVCFPQPPKLQSAPLVTLRTWGSEQEGPLPMPFFTPSPLGLCLEIPSRGLRAILQRPPALPRSFPVAGFVRGQSSFRPSSRRRWQQGQEAGGLHSTSAPERRPSARVSPLVQHHDSWVVFRATPDQRAARMSAARAVCQGHVIHGLQRGSESLPTPLAWALGKWRWKDGPHACPKGTAIREMENKGMGAGGGLGKGCGPQRRKELP